MPNGYRISLATSEQLDACFWSAPIGYKAVAVTNPRESIHIYAIPKDWPIDSLTSNDVIELVIGDVNKALEWHRRRPGFSVAVPLGVRAIRLD
jgi:hypothetical protein